MVHYVSKSTNKLYFVLSIVESNVLFYNLFEVAEPKMTSKNIAEPKLPSKNFEEPQLF
jgi:hypothetical protein